METLCGYLSTAVQRILEGGWLCRHIWLLSALLSAPEHELQRKIMLGSAYIGRVEGSPTVTTSGQTTVCVSFVHNCIFCMGLAISRWKLCNNSTFFILQDRCTFRQYIFPPNLAPQSNLPTVTSQLLTHLRIATNTHPYVNILWFYIQPCCWLK